MLHALFSFLCVRKLIVDYVYEFATALRLSSECSCTDAKTLPARGLPRARCAPFDFTIFLKKILTIVLRQIARAKGFLDGNSTL
jgi:hypothetical protein